MNNNFSFFLPTRKGSERVKNKNTRTFADVEGGILAIKISQLLKVERIDKIIISTNDPQTVTVAQSFTDEKIVIIPRPDHLCLSNTVLEELIRYIPTIINSGHVFWVHATSPFANESVYNEALDVYMDKVIAKNEYDSMFSVTKLQQFLWSKKTGDCINVDRGKVKWPRTQDLEPLYEINHAFFINSVENYISFSDRIGQTPLLFEMDKLHSFDIDWEDDFNLAEFIYMNKEFI